MAQEPSHGDILNILISRNYNAPDTSEYRATTTGILSLTGGQQFCVTLEPTELMIPTGEYPVQMLWSPKFNRMTPHLTVPGRTEIEIHDGNWATDSDGCIIVAMRLVSLYEIQDCPPAIDGIYSALIAAEADGEENTVTISEKSA